MKGKKKKGKKGRRGEEKGKRGTGTEEGGSGSRGEKKGKCHIRANVLIRILIKLLLTKHTYFSRHFLKFNRLIKLEILFTIFGKRSFCPVDFITGTYLVFQKIYFLSP